MTKAELTKHQSTLDCGTELAKTSAHAPYPAMPRTRAGPSVADCMPDCPMTSNDPLLRLGRWLLQQGYRFVTPTPATHARVNTRWGPGVAQSLQDVFGWSRPFSPGLLPQSVLGWLHDGDVLEIHEGLLRSRVRFSTLQELLYVHSAYPTIDGDAVFFGPDTYRFGALIHRTLAQCQTKIDCMVDIGCGSGVGGIIAAKTLRHAAAKVIFTDINAAAISYGFAAGVVLTVPPFPYRQGYAELSKGMPISFCASMTVSDYDRLHLAEVAMQGTQLVTSGLAGYVGVATGTGDTVKEASDCAYALARKVAIPNLRYRVDIGERVANHDLTRLKSLGYLA